MIVNDAMGNSGTREISNAIICQCFGENIW